MIIIAFIFTTLLGTNSYANQNWYKVSDNKPKVEFSKIILGGEAFEIASYTYIPETEVKGKFTTVHGYLVNCHYLRPIHEYLLKNNYQVTCVEMPGLGKSSGPRAKIDSFEIYSEFIQELPKVAAKSDYLIVHSTGAVGVFENLFQKNTLPYKHIFLAAPLVRSQKYFLVKYLQPMINLFVDSLSRDPKSAKYDSEELNQIHRDDPYWIGDAPLSWLGKMVDWNNKIEKQEPINQTKSLTIFYGGNDKVVDTPYNSKFLKARFPNANHIILKGASHYPFWDPDTQKEFFQILDSKL